MLEHALIVIASFLVAVVYTPLVRMAAVRWGIVDHPDPHRKLHGRIGARAGGSAILFTVLTVCGVALFQFDLVALQPSYTTPYLSLLTVMVGIWPIHACGRIAGRIDVIGPSKDGQTLAAIAKLVELLQDITPTIESLIEPLPSENSDALFNSKRPAEHVASNSLVGADA